MASTRQLKSRIRSAERPVTYAFVDAQNLNLGTMHDVKDAPSKALLTFMDLMSQLFQENKKTGSGGRITSLGKPSHRDGASIANKSPNFKQKGRG